MGDGERLVALSANVVHPLPKLLWILGVQSREGHARGAAATEDHVAVQVLRVRGSGVLIGHEGSEAARLVVPVG